MARGLKRTNDYSQALGEFYRQTPKAVFAALAYSYAAMGGEVETDNPEQVKARLIAEWRVLQENGIVPQGSVSKGA